MFNSLCLIETANGAKEVRSRQIDDTPLHIVKPDQSGYVIVHELTGLSLFSNVAIQNWECLEDLGTRFWRALTEPHREVWESSKNENILTENITESAIKILNKGRKECKN